VRIAVCYFGGLASVRTRTLMHKSACNSSPRELAAVQFAVFGRLSIGMTLAPSLLRPSSVHRRALPLPLASETNALRQPRAFNFCGTLMNAKTIVAAPPAAELAKVDAECSPMPIESPVAHGVWTHDIEALCRALEAQQRSALPKS
jgi:hypothetical protein